MEKLSLVSRVSLILLFAGVLAIILPLNTLANPDTLEVFPIYHDFGDVEVGTTVTTIITMTNMNGSVVGVDGLGFQAGGSDSFSLTNAPSVPFTVGLGQTVYVEVVFSPSAGGYLFVTDGRGLGILRRIGRSRLS